MTVGLLERSAFSACHADYPRSGFTWGSVYHLMHVQTVPVGQHLSLNLSHALLIRSPASKFPHQAFERATRP